MTDNSLDKDSQSAKIVSRQEARAAGDSFYFTGKPCLRGHVSARYVTTKTCCACEAHYYAKAKQSKIARQLAWNAENRDAKRAYDREWHKANREKSRALSRNRRARKAGGGGRHTPADIQEIAHAQRFKCAECRTSIREERHVDHIMPLARGGTNDRRNIQILCPSCNLRKGWKHPIDFAQEMGRLL